jgi:hypothetical protein
MRSIFPSLVCGLSILLPASAGETVLTPRWQVTDGIEAPESAYLDAASGFLFLSQIGEGGGGAKDGDGWISKLTPDGKMLSNRWVTGFDSPKGLRSHNGVLWVTDIDKVVSISIASGKVLSKIEVPGATFLNDLAIGADGTVYVSDMLKSRILAIRDGMPSVFLEGPEIEHPNGLLAHDGKLIVGGWGMDIADDFSTKTPGRLLAVDLKTKAVTRITPEPTGNLDGIESDGGDGFIVTDWRAGTLFHIAADGATTTLAAFPRGAADLAYLPKTRLLILPQMLENKLTAIELRAKALPGR